MTQGSSTSGAGSLSLWLGGAALVGVIVGGGLGFSGIFGSSPQPTTLTLDAVPVSLCPGGAETGVLHRGDRVLVVGRTADGGWVAVRNVRGSMERVFVRSEVVIPDGDLTGLPVIDCEQDDFVALGTTTTVPDEGSTTTATTDSTTTTVESTTTSPTTTAPDTTAPQIGQQDAQPDPVWEEDEGASCSPAPRQATISAIVTDAVGVTQVTARWTIPGKGTTVVTMSNAGGNLYTGTFGPIPNDAFVGGAPYEHQVTITIRAQDAAGNQGSATTGITVIDSESCFG